MPSGHYPHTHKRKHSVTVCFECGSTRTWHKSATYIYCRDCKRYRRTQPHVRNEGNALWQSLRNDNGYPEEWGSADEEFDHAAAQRLWREIDLWIAVEHAERLQMLKGGTNGTCHKTNR